MITEWVVYSVFVVASLSLFWIVVQRAKEHFDQYSLKEDDKKLSTIWGGPQKKLLVVYFLCLVIFSIFFAILIYTLR